jgi:hypothetical protein
VKKLGDIADRRARPENACDTHLKQLWHIAFWDYTAHQHADVVESRLSQ